VLFRRLTTSPLLLAAVVTLANAAKPATVDDTAYLLYARHIACAPTDPYGFDVFWWSRPEPAMNVLCPPVLPYWLAAGVALFGESVPLLKLWLFPFVWLLAWALRALLVRFARGSEPFALPLLMFSPAVLPAVNLMLDVPAVALALAAVGLFVRACRVGTTHLFSGLRGEVGGTHPTKTARPFALAALAGVVAALAMQTKYTAFAAPVVIAWYGLAHRRPGAAAVAVCTCVALFAGWELWLAEKYGHSHFWYHARGAAEAPPEGGSRLAGLARDRFELLLPLAGYLGCLAVGAGLLAALVLRVPRKVLAGTAAVWCVGFALIAALPESALMIGDHSGATAFWTLAGATWALACAVALGVLLFRVRKGLGVRMSADAWFLAGWLAIEVAMAFGLTPFAAARRVIGVTLVMGLIAARAASRIARCSPERRPTKWVLALGIGAGVAVAAIDTLDAFPEKVCAERAAEMTRERPPDTTVWYCGHWGFQHYCEAAGMKPLIAGETVARAGDYLVLPAPPPAPGFHRPYAGFTVRHPPTTSAAHVGVVEWDDFLSAKTVPNFYGGIDPVTGRDYPRLRVVVYRLRTDWRMSRLTGP
jgi:hypothetical protein